MDNSQRSFIIIVAILIIGFIVVAVIGFIVLLPLITNRSTADVAPTDAPLSMMTEETPTLVVENAEPSETPIPAASMTPTLEETDPPPPPEVTPTPTLQDIPPDIALQMNQIEEQVRNLRQLESSGPVSRALLTRSQLRQKIETEFFEDYSEQEARDDVKVLAALGLLEPGFDMITFYQDLFSEQIAGQYDDEIKRMDVIQGTGFDGTERLTYAHEYAHALQDQNFDFNDGLNYSNDACENDAERCAAVQALIEGDASFLELEWFYNHATLEDVNSIQEFYENYESPIYDSAPDYLKEDFIFPYSYGFTFVEHLFNLGGWEAVNAAFLDTPVSTEQILHPERYPDDKPIILEPPDLIPLLGEGWGELDHGIMGEWYTFLILAHGLNPQARLDTETAQSASDGWGGDIYVVYDNDQNGEIVLVMLSSWESEREANQFYNAFLDHSTSRFDLPSVTQANNIGWDHPGGFTNLRRHDQFTAWILAPNEEIAQSIWILIQADIET
jgi:hypothetical protein